MHFKVGDEIILTTGGKFPQRLKVIAVLPPEKPKRSRRKLIKPKGRK